MVMQMEEVGGSVTAGAMSVTLAGTLSLIVVLSGMVLFSTGDPVSVATAPTTRAPVSWSDCLKGGLALQNPTIVMAVQSKLKVLKHCMFGKKLTTRMIDTTDQI
jgi:hypothetical protein